MDSRSSWSVNEQLLEAAKSGDAEAIKHGLDEAGCDPLFKNQRGGSALMVAAHCGHEECVRVLLPVSDPLVLDKEGRSASQMASDWGNFALADMINAYVLALNEAAELSNDISSAPLRRAPVIRM